LVHHIFLYEIATDLKIENLVLDIWFLILSAQLRTHAANCVVQ